MRHFLQALSILSAAFAATLAIVLMASPRVLGGVDPPAPPPCQEIWDALIQDKVCPENGDCPEGYYCDWKRERDPFTG
jgi:hypothetical protein